MSQLTDVTNITSMMNRVRMAQRHSIEEAIQTITELQETHGFDALYYTLGITSGTIVEALELLNKQYLS